MHKLLGAVSALALIGAAAPAFALDNATATATANVITPISVTSDQNLVFGNILAGTGGTVVIATDDGRTKTGGVTLLAGTTPKAAHFHVAADTTGSATYTVAYTKVDLTGPGTPMAISAITPDNATPSGASVDLKVGATITVASGQTAGVYSGSVTATATYQ